MGFSPRSNSTSTKSGTLVAADSPCVGDGSRGYIGAERRDISPLLDIYAIKATLSTEDPPIACEGTGATFRAASAAWINVNEVSNVFAQMGWAKERAEGQTSVSRYIYCELSWGPNTDKLWKFKDPGSSAHFYRMELDSNTGVWTYYLDNVALVLSNPAYPQEAKDRMKRFTGFGGRWAGEVVDTKSHMLGTNTSRHVFSECYFKTTGGGTWQVAQFKSWNPTLSANWENNIVDTKTVEIWDTR